MLGLREKISLFENPFSEQRNMNPVGGPATVAEIVIGK
jgi:hypothetical protein